MNAISSAYSPYSLSATQARSAIAPRFAGVVWTPEDPQFAGRFDSSYPGQSAPGTPVYPAQTAPQPSQPNSRFSVLA